MGQGQSILDGKTIAIPYVEGDLDGCLTKAIIKEITSSADVQYRNNCADLLLNIVILDYCEENVGFRYDRTKHEKIKKYIIPVETRATLQVQVELFDNGSCATTPLLGPIILQASIVFDHDYYSSRHGVNIFSLGQLSDIDTAEEAARRPLNHAIAEKIADYLVNAW